jgi:hypothetical protein
MNKNLHSNNEPIIYSGKANHLLGGGKLYLYATKLRYKTHSFNLQNRELIIPLHLIKEVKKCNYLGIIPNSIAVILSTGRIEKFVVPKRTIWKNQIEQCLQNIDPKSVDADEPIFDKKSGVWYMIALSAILLCIMGFGLVAYLMAPQASNLKEILYSISSIFDKKKDGIIYVEDNLGTQDVYVEDNNIYFRGEKITDEGEPTNTPHEDGDLIINYGNPIFMEKLGIVVFKQSTKEYYGEESTFIPDKSGIWAYSITKKIYEKIVPYGNADNISNVRKVGESNFCFEKSGNGYCNSAVYRYSLIDWKENYIQQGYLRDVIDKGKYKNCILVHSSCISYEDPCTDEDGNPLFDYYGALLIVDMQGKVQGCLCYEHGQQEELECRKIDYNNIQFVEPPRRSPNCK